MFATVALGDLPAWLGLGAVVVGVVSYVQGRRDAWRSGAARVFVWADHRQNFRSGQPPEAIAVATVTNDSDEPVFSIKVELMSSARSGEPLCQRWVSVIPPRARSKPLPLDAIDPEAVARPAARLRLSFTDGRGRRWQRHEDQRLERLWRVRQP